jgi:hypothetical protein
LKSISPKTLRSRIVYGFLKRRSKGKVKYFKKYWFFIISSRPLVNIIINPLIPLDLRRIPA